jgi:L-lactate utilization protein LutB
VVLMSEDIGVWWVTFGFWVSGSFCLVSIEGFAGLLTSLARVYLSLLGVEA